MPSLATCKSNWQVFGFLSYLQKKKRSKENRNEFLTQNWFVFIFTTKKVSYCLAGYLCIWTELKQVEKKTKQVLSKKSKLNIATAATCKKKKKSITDYSTEATRDFKYGKEKKNEGDHCSPWIKTKWYRYHIGTYHIAHKLPKNSWYGHGVKLKLLLLDGQWQVKNTVVNAHQMELLSICQIIAIVHWIPSLASMRACQTLAN